jgi:transposase
MRGKQKTIRPVDPLGRDRWPVERTNAWLLAFRRVAVRRDRKLANYLAFVRLAVIVILARSF